jgi:GH25 family lysozyme M1 (1,4-beta-N-acetylmuramidase)
VEYVESSRSEVLEKRTKATVVDENDPSTYRIVQKEQQVQTDVEVPIKYTDSSGNVKYERIDGVWYEYFYSMGDLSLPNKRDDALALRILNLFGDYDGYEAVDIQCNEISGTGDETSYVYQILYRKETVLEEAPEDLEYLTVAETTTERTTTIQRIEEKVPVMREEETATGEYIYHGWQQLDGNTYYYDSSGEKVTGMQVIQGIGYEFDENGILTARSGVDVSSRNGTIDWSKAAASGIGSALIRCGYRGMTGGMLIADSKCEENIKGAGNAGLDVGIYFYSQAISEEEAEEEARFLLDMAEKYKITSPLVLSYGYTKDFQGRADGLSPADRNSCAAAACKVINAAGYTPMIYGNADWVGQCMELPIMGNDHFWIAQYNPELTYTGSCNIWRYTSKGTVDGIQGYTGLNMRQNN